jgi:hypothetical protein
VTAQAVQAALSRLDARSWAEYLDDLGRRDSPTPPVDAAVTAVVSGCPLSERRRLREQWLRDDHGHPLGAGMPTGRVLRADGQSHRAWWMSVLRADPCSYCSRPAGIRVLEDGRVAAGGTLDHIDPQSGEPRGGIGLHDWANYAGACSACNRKKGDLSLLSFLARRATAHAARSTPGGVPGRRRGPNPGLAVRQAPPRRSRRGGCRPNSPAR